MPSFLDDKGLNKFFQAIKAKFDTRYLNGPANTLIEQNKKSFLKVWRGTANEFKQVETKESDTAYLVEGESADTEYAPITHAARHSKDGADPITPTAIGAVGYDAAQSLTNDQKTQARDNINAAPGGYGYGENIPRIGRDNITDAEFVEMLEAKLATMSYNSAMQVAWLDHPHIDGTTRVGTLWKVDGGTYAVLTGDGYLFGSLIRVKRQGVWQPFEWVNPPMELGVEYRTTERYFTKPVYTQIINCGSMPDIGSNKSVSIAAFNVAVVTFISGWCSYYGAMFDDTLLGMTMTVNVSNIVIKNLDREVNSNAVMYALVKYTKTTD